MCDEISRENVVIDKLGHTPADAIAENRVEPNCTTDGKYDSIKKTQVAIFLILVLAVNLVACGFLSSTPQETVYEKLSRLAKKEYSAVQVNVTTVTEGITLHSSYVTTFGTIQYSVDLLNLLDSNASVLHEEYKSTLNGTAKVKDGQVVSIDGDAVSLPSYDALKGSFDFKRSYFEGERDKTGEFTATVKSPSELLGVQIDDVSDMKIAVYYDDDAIERIVLTYKTAQSSVTTEYVFK